MTLDLEIIKGEQEEVESGTENVSLSVEFKQLEKQNERLKEALVKVDFI